MKKQINKAEVCFILILVLVSACISESGINVLAASKAKKIIMNQSKVALVPGSKFRLKVKEVRPSKIGRAVTYRSNRKKVVTVSKKGVIKAKKTGKAKITIVSKKNKRVKTTVMVVVQEVKKEKKKLAYTADPPVTQTAIPVDSPQPPKFSPEPSKEPAEDTETFDRLPEMYQNLIFDEFSLMIKTATVNRIAIDLSECSSLSDSDKQILTGLISEIYGKETVQKTMDELKAEGSVVDDDTYGFVFQGGAFIKIREMERDSSGFFFQISCALNGLHAKGFTRCKAFINKDNKWYYNLDEKFSS